jgi:hypothetical protein
VARWFAEQGAKRERWDAPAADGESPEAEWGFEERLRADVGGFAADHGYPMVSVCFDEPEGPSPLVAELYRWWYRARGLPAERLLVDSFILMDPWWTLRLGAVPFWVKFNTEGSAAALERHLDDAEPYDEIRLMLSRTACTASGSRRSSAGALSSPGPGVMAHSSASTRGPIPRISRYSPAITRRCARSPGATRCPRR